ncbi:Transposon Tf2-9 polyprotein [Labeo rohita]|uniref:Gypsy retrotransposon integrase-like protein 1 n=1 Tax=Labeo rohita TaxID=84645 RepID=A0ABQ8L7U8_LABRO|nr:Transposon Tf2-9 polyprotein [Labeo rohita]
MIEETDLSDTFFVGMVTCEDLQESENTGCGQLSVNAQSQEDAVKNDKWVAPLQINGVLVTLKLDTGAKENLISMSDNKNMTEKPNIKKKPILLKDYNGKSIDSLGICRLKVTVKDKVHHLLFSVVAEELESLLGDKACKKLNLVKRVYYINHDNSAVTTSNSVDDIMQSFVDVFKCFGVLPYVYKIQLKENAQPVVHPARRVPAPLKDRLKKELDRMTTLGVIKRIQEPTDWVNSMVCVKKKNGDLRVCMDPKDLNDKIKREHYQIPKSEEIVNEMAGAKYFTKLDASQGFWQIRLDEDSTKYCTFNTLFGRYSFLRMPFGIISASEIFHRAMENIIKGLEGVRAYIDDIIIWGSSLQEHNRRLTKVLQKIRVSGLKLNKDKCQFGVQELLFLGDKLSSQGIQPDSEKINAILKMKCPTERKGVQRIMGMVNYIGKFILNLSSKTSCLRELLQKTTDFAWTDKHESEWQQLKIALTSAPVLQFFDPTKKTKVSTDACKNGLGAVLLQDDDEIWKPVAYASRSMTDSECRYAQIEKECLGLVFGLEKFHNYVYGLPTFTAETDNRPLIAIIMKNLNEMTPRIQRLMMKLQRYNFNLVYTPGKYLVLAAFPVSDAKSKQIAEETRKDDELQAVIDNMYNGWLTSSSPKFHDIRGDLCVVDGILLKQNTIIIPQSLRQDILHRIHEGHLGIEKCKRRARETVLWHGINKDIEKMVRQCDTCQKYRNNQTKEPMIIADLPTSPWEKVGMDLFHLKGNNYLVVIDYDSNDPELALLLNMSSKCVITHAKSIFARHGIPQTVVSDNGPCFSS